MSSSRINCSICPWNAHIVKKSAPEEPGRKVVDSCWDRVEVLDDRESHHRSWRICRIFGSLPNQWSIESTHSCSMVGFGVLEVKLTGTSNGDWRMNLELLRWGCQQRFLSFSGEGSSFPSRTKGSSHHHWSPLLSDLSAHGWCQLVSFLGRGRREKSGEEAMLQNLGKTSRKRCVSKLQRYADNFLIRMSV